VVDKGGLAFSLYLVGEAADALDLDEDLVAVAQEELGVATEAATSGVPVRDHITRQHGGELRDGADQVGMSKISREVSASCSFKRIADPVGLRRASLEQGLPHASKCHLPIPGTITARIRSVTLAPWYIRKPRRPH
jgi:Arc/MetJ family transcription regulator